MSAKTRRATTARGRKRWTADNLLGVAAATGDVNGMRLAKRQGAKRFDDALKIAAQFGHEDCMRAAAALGAMNFECALTTAAEFDHEDCMRVAVDLGARRFTNALISAGLKGNWGCMRAAKELGPTDLNQALGVAAAHNQSIMMCAVKKMGATNFNVALLKAAKACHVQTMCTARDMGATNYHDARVELLSSNVGTLFSARMYAGYQLLEKWIEEIAQKKKQHERILDVTMATVSLNLPIYVTLWILEWIEAGPLNELARMRLIEGVKTSCSKKLAARPVAVSTGCGAVAR